MVTKHLKSNPSICHPDKPLYAKGLCRNCYEKELRKNNPEFAQRQLDNNKNWRRDYREKKKQSDKNWLAKQDKVYYKAKRRARRLLKTYNLTIDEYELMLKSQDYKCKICHKSPKENKKLHVDHCHKSGKVRGLLCFRCNYGISIFYDDYESLRRASEYIKNSKINE